MEVGFVGGKVVVRRHRACRKKTGAVCLFGIGRKAPPPPPPTLAEQVGAYLKQMKEMIQSTEAEIWSAITQNPMVVAIKKNKTVAAITASKAFVPAMVALAIALGLLAVYLMRRRIYLLAMVVVAVVTGNEVAEGAETTTVTAKAIPAEPVAVAAVAAGAADTAGTIASRSRRTPPPPVAKMPPKKMPPLTKMPTKPSTPIVPNAPAKGPVAKEFAKFPKTSASGNKSAKDTKAAAPLQAGAAKAGEPKAEKLIAAETKAVAMAEAAEAASAGDAPDKEYSKLSGDEKKEMFREELDKQFDEALAEKGLSKDQLGPATLSRTFTIDIPRFRPDDSAESADGVPANKRRLSITIPIPMAFLTFAERLNGRLALIGVGVCLLRQLLEPGHPLFTEQLLQTLQLFFILPALLTSSLSSVQVDQSLPPDGSGF